MSGGRRSLRTPHKTEGVEVHSGDRHWQPAVSGHGGGLPLAPSALRTRSTPAAAPPPLAQRQHVPTASYWETGGSSAASSTASDVGPSRSAVPARLAYHSTAPAQSRIYSSAGAVAAAAPLGSTGRPHAVASGGIGFIAGMVAGVDSGRAGGQGATALPPPQRHHAASPLPRHAALGQQPQPLLQSSMVGPTSSTRLPAPLPTPSGGPIVQSRSLPAPALVAAASQHSAKPPRPQGPQAAAAAPQACFPPANGGPAALIGDLTDGNASVLSVSAERNAMDDWTPLKPASATTAQRALSRVRL